MSESFACETVHMHMISSSRLLGSIAMIGMVILFQSDIRLRELIYTRVVSACEVYDIRSLPYFMRAGEIS